MSRVLLEPGWLLQARPWRDTSMLVEAITRTHGRVGLVARGVRGPRGRWRGLLQPFRHLLLSWSGRGELSTLTGVEPGAPAVILHGDALLSAYYVNELMLRLLARHDPHPGLVDAYASVIPALQAERAQPALRTFEKCLLDELGYGLSLRETADTGEPLEAARRYRFDPTRGPLAGPGDLPEVSGATLLALDAGSLDNPVGLREARMVLRAALDACLGPRPLRTREMLTQYRRLK